MSGPRPVLILASASPRRSDILATLRIPVEVRPVDADEASIETDDHEAYVREAALLKLERALAEALPDGAFVLTADTIVCVDRDRLGKPRDDGEALEMLIRLAGRNHVVRTAIALGRAGRGVLDARVVQTRVWFREASREELARYVATGESRDKAGAYGIQGMAGGFVERVDGSYANVVGLPSTEVVRMLLHHGALERWP